MEHSSLSSVVSARGGEYLKSSDKKYWLVVASVEHVNQSIKEGYCQLVNGKEVPLRKMKKGDGLIYYSSTISLKNKTAVKAFTAIGFIADDVIYTYDMTNYFYPHRRKVNFLKNSQKVAIEELQLFLQFVDNNLRYSYKFRQGHLEITEFDFKLIAFRMGIRQIE